MGKALNGTAVRWAGVILTFSLAFATAIYFISSVHAATVTNRDRIDENKAEIKLLKVGIGEIKDMLHEIDKQQALIMQKLGIEDEGD